VIGFGVLALVVLGAVPLLPLCVRPLTQHRQPGVRRFGKALAMLLHWLGFNFSLLTLWGAFRFVPAWWALLVGVPFVQIPAAWFSYRVVFGGDDGKTR
jgi:hypothetical protein